MVKAEGSTHPLAINLDLWKAVEMFYGSSLVTWRLGWYAILLSNYLRSKCGQDPVLEGVFCKLHGAIRESHQISARGTSVAIGVQCRLVVNTSTFRDCSDLQSSLLATPFVGSSLFGGQFMFSEEAAMHSQEQLSQVRCLASAGSRSATKVCSGGSAPPKQCSSPRKDELPPPYPAASAALWVEGGSNTKRCHCKNSGRSSRSAGNEAPGGGGGGGKTPEATTNHH